MQQFNKKPMQLNLKLVFLFLTLTSKIFAQNINYKIVGNEIEDKSMLKVRPNISFSIPPSDLVEGLPVTFNLEAQYWTKMIDYRATGSFGTFKGVAVGATYHRVSKIKNVKDKFIISETQSGKKITTTYFKAPVNIYRISGPCVDFTNGVYGGAGFYTKLDFGWDFQSYGRAYAEYGTRTIKGSRNGWTSLKLQGVLANVAIDMTDYFKLGAGTGKYTEERKMAVGGQVNIGAAARPWKRVSLYLSLPLGYMRFLGVSDAPETSNKGAFILNIVLGAQVKL